MHSKSNLKALKCYKSAFTLIELISVLVLLGTLTTFVSLKLADVFRSSRGQEKVSLLCATIEEQYQQARLEKEEVYVSLTNTKKDLVLHIEGQRPLNISDVNIQTPLELRFDIEGHIDQPRVLDIVFRHGGRGRIVINTRLFPPVRGEYIPC